MFKAFRFQIDFLFLFTLSVFMFQFTIQAKGAENEKLVSINYSPVGKEKYAQDIFWSFIGTEGWGKHSGLLQLQGKSSVVDRWDLYDRVVIEYGRVSCVTSTTSARVCAFSVTLKTENGVLMHTYSIDGDKAISFVKAIEGILVVNRKPELVNEQGVFSLRDFSVVQERGDGYASSRQIQVKFQIVDNSREK